MAKRSSKNLEMREGLKKRFDEYVQKMKPRTAGLLPWQVLNGAVILFLDQDEETQLKMIAAARNYDLEEIRRANAAAADADGLVDQVATEADVPAPQQTPRKKKAT